MNNSNIPLKRSQTHSKRFNFGGGILIRGNLRKARKGGAGSCAPLLLAVDVLLPVAADIVATVGIISRPNITYKNI